MENKAKDLLIELSKILIRLHKTMIGYEADQHEKREQRKFTPHEMLHLTLNDTHFSWLRKVSELIVAVDTLVDDKEKEPRSEDVEFFRDETKKLFFTESEETREFKTKLMSAVAFNADVLIQLSSLRNFIKQNTSKA